MAVETTTTASGGHESWEDKLIDYAINHTAQLVSAILIVVGGLLAARWIGALFSKWLERKSLEEPVRILLTRVIRFLIFAMALVIALGTVGIDVTALVAGASVAGLGVGLALQGVLGNLVAGLTIIFTKPFRVGEYISLLGVEGQVKAIELFTTTLAHADQSKVVIPNRKIVGEVLHNFGTIRQLDLSVGIAYGTNLADALATVHAVLAANARVLKSPAPVVGVSELADSAINLAVKPWVQGADYGPAGGEIYQALVGRFHEQRIQIPVPQREVRVLGGAGWESAKQF